MRPSTRFACALLATVLCLTTTATADEPPEQPVDPRSPVLVVLPPGSGHYGWSDIVITTASGVTILVASLLGPSASHMTGGVFIDEDVRSALRLTTEGQRRIARDASDAFLNIMLAFPFVVDVAAYTAWYRQSPKVAWNIGLVDLETLVATEGIRTIFNTLVSRERPYGRNCRDTLHPDRELPALSQDCDSRSRYYSFFSGHTSQTFASAALTCSHHLNLDLYGGGWADATPCLAGFGLAAAAGTLRIIGDMHYLSDVVVGAAFGTAMGFVVPWLVLYRKRGTAAEATSDDGPHVMIVPMPNGAGLAGVF